MTTKSIDTKITPEAAQTVVMTDVLDALEEVIELMKEEEPGGDLVSKVVSVTTIPVEVNLGVWLKATLYNNVGGSDVYVYNKRQQADTRDAALKADESLVIDRRRRTKKWFYLVCASGTATVRIFYQ